jgi:hypothetical protein
VSRATQTTARNRPIYFQNSDPLIWRQPVFSAIEARMDAWPSLIAYVPLTLFCAGATIGHAAALPSPAMNSRRLIGHPSCRFIG